MKKATFSAQRRDSLEATVFFTVLSMFFCGLDYYFIRQRNHWVVGAGASFLSPFAAVSALFAAVLICDHRRNYGKHRQAEANHSGTQAGGHTVLSPGTSQGTFETGVSPDTVELAEPIKAWRALRLVVSDNRIELGSLNLQQNGTFAAAGAQAECHVRFEPHGNGSPDPFCTCGFYSLKQRGDVEPHNGTLLAEVDLYGKIIEAEFGYRAEYQRVLSVTLPKRDQCHGEFLCTGKPTIMAWKDDVAVVVCDQCASNLSRVASASTLAGYLGCEVRWAE